jgi:hypothetical protein
MSSGFVSTTVSRRDAPDIVFDGRVIASITGEKTEEGWKELSLFELSDTSWLAVTKDCTDGPGMDDGEVLQIQVERPSNMHNKAMTLWGWSWLAKDLARSAGWDVRERVGKPDRSGTV